MRAAVVHRELAWAFPPGGCLAGAHAGEQVLCMLHVQVFPPASPSANSDISHNSHIILTTFSHFAPSVERCEQSTSQARNPEPFVETMEAARSCHGHHLSARTGLPSQRHGSSHGEKHASTLVPHYCLNFGWAGNGVLGETRLHHRLLGTPALGPDAEAQHRLQE